MFQRKKYTRNWVKKIFSYRHRGFRRFLRKNKSWLNWGLTWKRKPRYKKKWPPKNRSINHYRQRRWFKVKHLRGLKKKLKLRWWKRKVYWTYYRLYSLSNPFFKQKLKRKTKGSYMCLVTKKGSRSRLQNKRCKKLWDYIKKLRGLFPQSSNFSRFINTIGNKSLVQTNISPSKTWIRQRICYRKDRRIILDRKYFSRRSDKKKKKKKKKVPSLGVVSWKRRPVSAPLMAETALSRYLWGRKIFKAEASPRLDTGAQQENLSLTDFILGVETCQAKKIKPQNNTTSIQVCYRKQYHMRSYLSHYLRRFSKRPQGQKPLSFNRRYKKRSRRIPLKVSLTRFWSNKIFRTYSSAWNSKSLKSIFTSKGRQKNRSVIQSTYVTPDLEEKRHPNLQSKASSCIRGNMQALLLSMESRLDSTVLRLLNFKPAKTVKNLWAKRRKKIIHYCTQKNPGQTAQSNLLVKIHYTKRKKIKLWRFRKKKITERFKKWRKHYRRVKNPMSMYTSLQVKQFINHRHITVRRYRDVQHTFFKELPDACESLPLQAWKDLTSVGQCVEQVKRDDSLIKKRRPQNNVSNPVSTGRQSWGNMMYQAGDRIDMGGYIKHLGFSFLPDERTAQVIPKGTAKARSDSSCQDTFYRLVPQNKSCIKGFWSKPSTSPIISSFEANGQGGVPRVVEQVYGFSHSFENSQANEKFVDTETKGIQNIVRGLQNQILKENLKQTLCLRKMIKKDSNLYPSLRQKENKEKKSVLTPKSIKDLKLKRFTEAFYITYKNMHLIPSVTTEDFEPSRFQKSNMKHVPLTSNKNTGVIRHNVERAIQPVYENIGYNQSLYTLWPVGHLLKIKPWSSHMKKKFEKRTNKRLLKYQKKAKWNMQIKKMLPLGEIKMKQDLNSLFLLKKSLLMKKTPVSRYPSIIQSVRSRNQRISSISKAKSNLDKKKFFSSQSNYASFVFNTKKPSFVKWQQEKQSKSYFSRFFYKLDFTKIEYDFYQFLSQYWDV